jgi:RES domain-containing protein
MIAYRLARTIFCDVSGEGAKRYGGRWNLPGHPVLYASASISAALLERLTIDPELFAADRCTLYSVMEFEFPDRLLFKPSLKHLPKGWDAIPSQMASMQFGTRLLREGRLAFAVPSVVDSTSWNIILNPLARDFGKVKWKTYSLRLDQRIVRQ